MPRHLKRRRRRQHGTFELTCLGFSSFALCLLRVQLIHRYLVVCAISNLGTPEEVVDYARQISCGYRPPVGRWFMAAVATLHSSEGRWSALDGEQR